MKNGIGIEMKKLTSTVVVALYNGEKFIIEQLDSIKNQTRMPDEVLICDDGSTDNSVEIVSNYLKKNNLKNWKIVENPYNKGYAKNFIDMIDDAKYEIVFLSDQDDIWKSDKIENMLSVMESNMQVDLLSGANDFEVIEGKHSNVEVMETNTMKFNGSVEKVKQNKKNMHIQRSGCLMCVRKSFFNTIKNYWILDWAHDDFLWKYAMLNDSCFYLHKLTITRRLHNNNTSRNSSKKNRNKEARILQLKKMIRQNNAVITYIDKNPRVSDEEDFFRMFNKAIENRIKFLKTKNIFLFFELAIVYREYYPRIKGLFLDFGIAYLGEKICQKF
ncbi:Glycosyltransferase, GT2 family [Streptococcus equinus]|nr:Glycosyltransferase, GT2 family [Streptococcus equinus]